MRSWRLKLTASVGPLCVLCALAALDYWSHDQVPFTGVVAGMGLLGLLIAMAWWSRHRLEPLPSALQSALRSVADGAVGVVLVFLLVVPLTALLPQPWVTTLTQEDRATDLLVMLILGVALLVASRAMLSASRQAAMTARAERDAACVRAELAEGERVLARAELQVLRAQVEPHFLWNTLANVEYLMRKDPKRAQAMMAHLIDYLRSSLPSARSGSATVGSEFASLRAYVGLMQHRMGDRLQAVLDLDPTCAEVPFAPLVLQTLVENAIKHGLEPLPGAARLCVSARRSGTDSERLVIEVVDNGVGLQASPRTRGTGLGLRNVRERLQAMHGSQATLAITGLASGGVRARIDWPVDGPTQPLRAAP